MNFVLCISRTAHAEEKKKKGHTNPDVRTIIIIITRSMQGMCGASAAKEHCA